MNFSFATATQIVFGEGVARKLGHFASEKGQRVLLVTGKNSERSQFVVEQFSKKGLTHLLVQVKSEPTIGLIKEIVAESRAFQCDLVLGIGGGSVLDAAKAIAALLPNQGEPLDYLEVIGKGLPLVEPPLPYIAVPTTAGTGAEVTRNAVLKSTEHNVKVSMRSPLMLPDLAVVDPELTYTVPPAVTASTGLDALTQVIEPYVSNQANPLTDAIACEGIKRAACSLRLAYHQGEHVEARRGMALASVFGGLALANAKLGAVHGFAGPLGGMYEAPHGVVCARFLPYVMETNIRALQEREPNSPVLERYEHIAKMLTGRSEAKAADAIDWIHQLCEELAVPPLSQFGLREEDFGELIAKARRSSSMKGNPIILTDEEMLYLLRNA